MNSKLIIKGLVIVSVIKVALAYLPSFEVDMSAWLAWANRLGSYGTSHFYSDDVWTQYTPGYLYFLWLIGKLQLVSPLIIKLCSIVFDLVGGYIIYLVLSKKSKTVGYWAFAAYSLNPVIVFNSSVWGQIDGVLSTVMLASSYYLIEKKKEVLSYLLLAVALLIKLQAVAILPALLIIAWKQKKVRETLAGMAVLLIILVFGFVPFFPADPIGGIISLVSKMGVSYPYTSLYAYNVWRLVGMWKVDSLKFAWLTYFDWGVVMVGIASLITLIFYVKYYKNKISDYWLFMMFCMIFFLFPTRVHERYMTPMFGYLVIYLASAKKKYMYYLGIILSLVYTINLYLPYSYYANSTNWLKNISFENAIQNAGFVLSIINIMIFFVLLLSPRWENTKESIPVALLHGDTKQHRANKNKTQY